MEIVEPSVLMEGEDGNGVGTNKTKELLIEVLKVGVQCSMESPGERMDIRHVVAEMHKIKNRFFSIRT
ncbi:Non-specific serine/threonine protein kinase [Bertholletia excelsa]